MYRDTYILRQTTSTQRRTYTQTPADAHTTHGCTVSAGPLPARLAPHDPMDCGPPGPLPVGLSRQECCSGLPCPPPGDLPDPGIKPTPLRSSTLAGGRFTTNTTWGAVHAQTGTRIYRERDVCTHVHRDTQRHARSEALRVCCPRRALSPEGVCVLPRRRPRPVGAAVQLSLRPLNPRVCPPCHLAGHVHAAPVFLQDRMQSRSSHNVQLSCCSCL